MAFVGERVRSSEDKKYVEAKGFKYITGEVVDDVRYWAIDRDNDIILISRGGGGLDMPESYGIFLDGFLIDMEGHEETEGDYYEEGSKIHWYITWIGVPKTWFESGCGTDKLKRVITEAFTAYAYINLKPEKVLEVTVDISVDPVAKWK